MQSSPHWKNCPIHVVDFEGSARTGIVEYGVATLLGGEVVAVSSRLCAAAAPIPGVDTQCHGLRDADLAGTAPFSDEWERFAGMRRGGMLCAHHAATEHNLLKRVWPYPGAVPDFSRALPANRVGTAAAGGAVAAGGTGDAAAGAVYPSVNDWGPWLDTCRLAAVWHPAARDFGLGALIKWFRLGDELESAAGALCPPKRARYHCAPYDALASALLLRHMCALPGKTDASLGKLVCDSLGFERQTEWMQTELELF
ncbi:MAG: hypothetical protein LBR07_10385 [Puniceicoccales bacterium]|jgi:DNA polymerase-3 subunit epsilon|nr:hypothetical protein [Puniceicoccales bacterium]